MTESLSRAHSVARPLEQGLSRTPAAREMKRRENLPVWNVARWPRDADRNADYKRNCMRMPKPGCLSSVRFLRPCGVSAPRRAVAHFLFHRFKNGRGVAANRLNDFEEFDDVKASFPAFIFGHIGLGTGESGRERDLRQTR